MRRDVEFAAADGTALRGRLYAAEGVNSSPLSPGVLMTHGFSATIDMALDAYAAVMSDAGITVLMYDHRHLGGSDLVLGSGLTVGRRHGVAAQGDQYPHSCLLVPCRVELPQHR